MTTRVPHSMTTGISSTTEMNAAITAAIRAQHPVDTILFRMSATNPSTEFDGTWALITGDATLTFGDGLAQTGTVIGINTHTLTDAESFPHSHDAGTLLGPVHTHAAAGLTFAGVPHNHIATTRSYTSQGQDQSLNLANSSSHSANTEVVTNTEATATGTIGGATSAGNATTVTGATAARGGGAAHNIQSARIALNVWQRTA